MRPTTKRGRRGTAGEGRRTMGAFFAPHPDFCSDPFARKDGLKGRFRAPFSPFYRGIGRR